MRSEEHTYLLSVLMVSAWSAAAYDSLVNPLRYRGPKPSSRTPQPITTIAQRITISIQCSRVSTQTKPQRTTLVPNPQPKSSSKRHKTGCSCPVPASRPLQEATTSRLLPYLQSCMHARIVELHPTAEYGPKWSSSTAPRYRSPGRAVRVAQPRCQSYSTTTTCRVVYVAFYCHFLAACEISMVLGANWAFARRQRGLARRGAASCGLGDACGRVYSVRVTAWSAMCVAQLELVRSLESTETIRSTPSFAD